MGGAYFSALSGIKFNNGEQEKKISYMLEYKTEWQDVMTILLVCSETYHPDTIKTKELASYKLKEWALDREGGDELDLKTNT